MTPDEARAELARRKALEESGQDNANTPDEPMPSLGLKDASWEQALQLMPGLGPKGHLPENTKLTPLQSGLLSFSSGVDATGHGIQQGISKLLGLDEWEQKNDIAAKANRRVGETAKEHNPISGHVGEGLGAAASMLPFEGLGAGAQAISKIYPWLSRAVTGGLWGESQYRTPDESELLNVGIPAVANAVLPPVMGAIGSTIKSGFKRLTGAPAREIAKDIIQVEGASPEYTKKIAATAKGRIKAAQEVGVELTPAEATGSPKIAEKQASVGKTPEGAGKLEEFYRGKGGRYEQENAAVQGFFDTLGVNSKDVGADTARKIRGVANEIIEGQLKNRQQLADPLYKKAAKNILAPKTGAQLMNDEIIKDAAASIQKSPAYREASKAMNKNSIEYWDLVKRNIDDKIETAIRGGDKNLARILQQSKTKLTNELDKASPLYKQARKTFESESGVLEELTSTNLGKIANLPDAQLKKVSSMLFDKNEIDPKTLDTIRTSLFKTNPQVYYDALAQNMKSTMDTVARSATKREGPAFYRAILQNDKAYNMYKDALKSNPDALRRLELLKTVFQDLGGDFTPKTASGLKKTGMTNTRDVLEGMYQKLFKGGKYDATAVEFITNPKWFDQAEKILTQPDGYKKSVALMNLLNKISQSKGVRLFQTKEEIE